MIFAQKIVEIAAGELGVKESPANSNRQKYGKEYGVNGTAWCCHFVWWVFKQGGAAALFYGGEKTAYCPTLMQYYKGKGQLVKKDFRSGDIIFFDINGNGQPDHVGIVERVVGDKIYTIEGNTSVGNDTNGGQVMRRIRTGKAILCAARPKYDEGKESCEVKLETLKKGSESASVKALQTLLIGYGYDCGKHGADGDFGADTERAVCDYQKKEKLTVDGEVGRNTWTKLLGGM